MRAFVREIGMVHPQVADRTILEQTHTDQNSDAKRRNRRNNLQIQFLL
jgi:hypothetical protein